MPNASKNKGKSFERDLAKHLISVFGLNFERVWSSGAFVGGSNSFRIQKLSKSQSLLATGDLIVPDELSHLSFECKFYRDFSWPQLFSKNIQLDKWISQASACEKLWFLVVKINRTTPFVVFDSCHHSKWALEIPGNFLMYGKCVICSLDGFFERNKNYLLVNNALMANNNFLNQTRNIIQSENEQAALSAVS
jgi:hypothetical protein